MHGSNEAQNGLTGRRAIEAMRAAGKLTAKDEAHLCRLDAETLKRASPAALRILGPLAEEQAKHYEAAVAAQR